MHCFSEITIRVYRGVQPSCSNVYIKMFIGHSWSSDLGEVAVGGGGGQVKLLTVVVDQDPGEHVVLVQVIVGPTCSQLHGTEVVFFNIQTCTQKHTHLSIQNKHLYIQAQTQTLTHAYLSLFLCQSVSSRHHIMHKHTHTHSFALYQTERKNRGHNHT